jgi:GT2 family glycosyltransferase
LQLSIIIINYNVRYFLEQCLHTVLNAVTGLEAEIIVVDNHSTDGSMEWLPALFPQVQFIQNKENLGFAKANNQALAVSSGNYVLFLNPDTLVPENALRRCLSYMQEHPKAGSLGVRMLDGRGRFLPESKRSFPSPLSSFYKLTGLAAVFNRSRVFNRYALGNLSEHENHIVDVLAGAFMLVKKDLLLQLNGFDESYFLYGEDIDLSYRVQQAGFENHYFAGTSIIHFKGESSGNNELNRVKFFYRAMQVFVEKHYRTGAGKLFAIFLQLAIIIRGFLSAMNRLFKPVALPLIDGLLLWLSLRVMCLVWVSYFRSGKDFGVAFLPYALPVFSAWFVLCTAFTGLYDKRYKTSKTILSLAFAVLGMLAVYSLLPEQMRFSRGVFFWGGLMGSLLIFLFRQLLLRKKRTTMIRADENEQTVVVATEHEYEAIKGLLTKALLDQSLLGRISPCEQDHHSIGHLSEITSLIKNIRINRIIFCVGGLSLTEIITQVQRLTNRQIHFLFHVSESNAIMGSHTIAPGADIVTGYVDYRIASSYQQRMKRIVDVLLSLFLTVSIPFHHKPGVFAKNIYRVLTGSKTWVGYATAATGLPVIKTSVISTVGNLQNSNISLFEKADSLYAKNYDWWQDIVIVFQNYRHLG